MNVHKWIVAAVLVVSSAANADVISQGGKPPPAPGAIEDKGQYTNNPSNQSSGVSNQTGTFSGSSLFEAKVGADENQCVPIGRLNDVIVWAGDCATRVIAAPQGTFNPGQ